MTETLQNVIGYLRRGWSVVYVPWRRKGPADDAWQTLRITEATASRYFNGRSNIGVMMGPPSHDLADIDLDCPEARMHAAAVLPPTLRFGRASSPASHWLSQITGAFPPEAADKAVVAFDDPIKLKSDRKAARLLELRTGANGRGCQTVFPGSAHEETGEAIRWEPDSLSCPLAQLEADRLVALGRRLAALALMTRYWPPQGARHETSLALGGILARAGWDAPAIEQFVGAVVRAAHDPRPDDRVRCAVAQVAELAAGKHVFGLPKLRELLGVPVVVALAEWLGLSLKAALPVVRTGVDLTAMAAASEQAIVAAGLPVYRRDALVVRPLVLDARGLDDKPIKTVGLSPVPVVMMQSLMEQAARFERYDARSDIWKPCQPPARVAELILARAGEWPFAAIRGVLACPSLRPDGTVLMTPGLDPATGMYLIDPPPMPDIPERLSHAQGKAAMAVLDRLLDEFPFDDAASRAVALSGLISPVLLAALPHVPLHGFSAPEAGTGKSYLMQLASAIATGRPVPAVTTGGKEEEFEKRLDAALLKGYPLLAVDNVSRPLGGDKLCRLIEQPSVDVRVLGKSVTVPIEPRLVTFATGNNLVLVGDLVRRAVLARMNAGSDTPWTREFRSDPVAAVLADRGTYIAAVLTAVRAWLGFDEKPLPPIASFKPWSDMVRSMLVAFGYTDPAATIAQAVAEDPDRQSFAAVLTAWFQAFGPQEVTAAELVTKADKRDGAGNPVYPDLRDALLVIAATKGGDISTQRLGYWLRNHRDRMIAGRVLRRHDMAHGGVMKWSVA
jgi:Bifunctional DNA primase/polymerase, N-terminal